MILAIAAVAGLCTAEAIHRLTNIVQMELAMRKANH